jgi:hypothetical protein
MAVAEGAGSMSDVLKLDEEQAARIIESQGGLHLHIPLGLLRRLGDLEQAAFVGFAAWLSSCCVKQGGWFFLEQERECEPDSDSMFRQLGSWKAAIGLGKKAHLRARNGLEEGGLLYKIPSRRKQKILGLKEPPAIPDSAFIIEQMRGAPPRLHCRVRQVKYLAWLAEMPNK